MTTTTDRKPERANEKVIAGVSRSLFTGIGTEEVPLTVQQLCKKLDDVDGDVTTGLSATRVTYFAVTFYGPSPYYQIERQVLEGDPSVSVMHLDKGDASAGDMLRALASALKSHPSAWVTVEKMMLTEMPVLPVRMQPRTLSKELLCSSPVNPWWRCPELLSTIRKDNITNPSIIEALLRDKLGKDCACQTFLFKVGSSLFFGLDELRAEFPLLSTQQDWQSLFRVVAPSESKDKAISVTVKECLISEWSMRKHFCESKSLVQRLIEAETPAPVPSGAEK